MNDDLKYKIIAFISSCNEQGWVEEYGVEYRWKFPDGTEISSQGDEYDDVPLWLENYDEMEDKIVESIDDISMSEPEIEPILEGRGNLLEFKYVIMINGGEVSYRFMQFGEGEEAGRSIQVSDVDLKVFESWMDHASENGWSVEPIE